MALNDEWKTTMNGESAEFVIYDNNCDNRILIFATSRALHMFSKATIWFMDGTFKCSNIFTQLFVIRAEFENNVFMIFSQTNYKQPTRKC